ncbi:M24 family metallopeptidase [Sporosarcina cyprini]|uniref:M24 family metallopeptidase n=1 Tax=Sporosarcina cyprini TaxID=2910523 RepID=UPI001EE06E0F|nr:Xaa-Pro peptidase family protein [Sporosarcina cyprini]
MLTSRIHQFRSYLEARHIDVALLWDPDNQFYMTGFRAISYSRPIVTLIDEKEIQLIIPALEEAHAAEKAAADRTYVYYEQYAFREKPLTYEEHLTGILKSYPAPCTIGIEADILPASVYQRLLDMGFQLADIGGQLTKMRSIKSADEIELLKIAGSLSDLAIGESLRHARVGVSELEFDSHGDRLLLELASRDYPDELIGYADWTCSGIQRSEMPHLYSSTRKFTNGDVVVHSRQVWFNNYRAENERTFMIGNGTEKQKDLLKLMIEAQQVGMEMIRPGISAKDVDIATFQVFDKAGYGEFVQHRTGHGLGLSEHEEPYLRFDNELILQEGMVYTIEPGIYVPGVGGFRHSDTVIITENGSFSITAYPRDFESMLF